MTRRAARAALVSDGIERRPLVGGGGLIRPGHAKRDGWARQVGTRPRPPPTPTHPFAVFWLVGRGRRSVGRHPSPTAAVLRVGSCGCCCCWWWWLDFLAAGSSSGRLWGHGVGHVDGPPARPRPRPASDGLHQLDVSSATSPETLCLPPPAHQCCRLHNNGDPFVKSPSLGLKLIAISLKPDSNNRYTSVQFS